MPVADDKPQDDCLSWKNAIEALFHQFHAAPCTRSLLVGATLIVPEREEIVKTGLVAIGDTGQIDYAGKWDPLVARFYSDQGYRQWNLQGCLLIPCFCDAHVHLQAEFSSGFATPSNKGNVLANMKNLLNDGIGIFCDCGSKNDDLLHLRNRLPAGKGPKMFVSGPPITTPAGHLHQIGIIAKGPTALKDAVDLLAEKDVDFIKVCATGGKLTSGSDPAAAQYSSMELAALVERANKHGLIVAAHAHGKPGIRACIEAGVHCIEHCSFMLPGGGFELDERLLARMAEQGTFLGFTMTGFRRQITARQLEDLGQGREVLPFSFFKKVLKQAGKEGVQIVISSDSGIPGSPFGNLAKRLWAAANIYSLSFWEIIRAVTTTPAQLCGMGDSPWRVGRRAGLVAVKGNCEGLLQEAYEVKHLFLGQTALIAQ